jgi:hypothetical protein
MPFPRLPLNAPTLALVALFSASQVHAQVRVEILAQPTRVAPGGHLELAARANGGKRENLLAWRVLDGPGQVERDAGGAWIYEPGVLAPAGLAHLEVSSTEDPGQRAVLEVRILEEPGHQAAPPRALPDELEVDTITHLIHQYAALDAKGRPAPGAPSAALRAMPFEDPATGRRPGRHEPVTPATHPWYPAAHRGQSGSNPVFAYGLARSLHLPGQGGRALLSWREGGEWRQLDVTGQDQVDLTCRGRLGEVRLERLVREGPHRWRSEIHMGRLVMEGLVPLAGGLAPGLDPAGEERQGLSARFEEPWGVAEASPAFQRALPQHPEDRSTEPCWLVADHKSHALRSVHGEARVATLAGVPGQPGYQEGMGRHARFRDPTFLVVHGPSDTCFVADTGNGVIRSVGADGRTALVAGTPQQHGCQDTSPEHPQALFDHPQGLAVAADRTLYVADTGNRVIRVISPDRQVSTLAGRPGAAGTQDGSGDEAGFTDLRGLALDEAGRVLYVLDGDSLRTITLPGPEGPGRNVTTVLGDPLRPGFRDQRLSDDAGARVLLARQPCLDNPCGIMVYREVEEGGEPGFATILITDRGNRAVRACVPALHLLVTMLGEPPPPPGEEAPGPMAGIRWGLMHSGYTYPGDPRYALLDSPRCFVKCLGLAKYCLSEASCLATFESSHREVPPDPGPAWNGPDTVPAGTGFRIGLRLRYAGVGRMIPDRCWYDVALVRPDGLPIRPGPLQNQQAAAVVGKEGPNSFTRLDLEAGWVLEAPGQYQVVFTVLTPDGAVERYQRPLRVE